MTLWDLLRNVPCVEGRIQISYFHEDKYDREIYFEGDADRFYPSKFEKIMNREIAYIFPQIETVLDEITQRYETVPMICIELSDEE